MELNVMMGALTSPASGPLAASSINRSEALAPSGQPDPIDLSPFLESGVINAENYRDYANFLLGKEVPEIDSQFAQSVDDPADGPYSQRTLDALTELYATFNTDLCFPNGAVAMKHTTFMRQLVEESSMFGLWNRIPHGYFDGIGRRDERASEGFTLTLPHRQVQISPVTGASVSGITLAGALLRSAYLPGHELAGANLQFTDLQDADLQGANLKGANLNGANLQGANLNGANLQGANLNGANLREASLQGADLRGANLENAEMNWARLDDADLERAYLVGARLDNASLHHAKLDSANLKDISMRNAIAPHVSLSGADLTGADMFNVVLRGANLKGADLTNVKLFVKELEPDEYFFEGMVASRAVNTMVTGSPENSGRSSVLGMIESIDERFSKVKVELMAALIEVLTMAEKTEPGSIEDSYPALLGISERDSFDYSSVVNGFAALMGAAPQQ
ncbi:pentapeptide repeat-containing protein [Paraburkholderia graminis]|uniref:Uncharacterized protein YjbI with pentapeptide repeats n=1 Tax=Paraburkholderia graminis TaxID=60548 RepID=A0ABD5CUU0_9BURK|nr:pentapeptide repeat-containing protein [Paraburkholderia graminis]MDR6208297.1 uncharacterized protein YjbI with pentapeptide repeats [Paraburkholderia graminis]